MNNALLATPPAENEPTYAYAPGGADRAKLKAELARLLSGDFDVPLVIGGKEVRTGTTASILRPDDRAKPLAATTSRRGRGEGRGRSRPRCQTRLGRDAVGGEGRPCSAGQAPSRPATIASSRRRGRCSINRRPRSRRR